MFLVLEILMHPRSETYRKCRMRNSARHQLLSVFVRKRKMFIIVEPIKNAVEPLHNKLPVMHNIERKYDIVPMLLIFDAFLDAEMHLQLFIAHFFKGSPVYRLWDSDLKLGFLMFSNVVEQRHFMVPKQVLVQHVGRFARILAEALFPSNTYYTKQTWVYTVCIMKKITVFNLLFSFILIFGFYTHDVSAKTFTKDLWPGTRDQDVVDLQQYLNNNGYKIAESGPGAPGQETNFFGRLTRIALTRFQNDHYNEILAGIKFSKGTGIFGPSTRAYINSLLEKLPQDTTPPALKINNVTTFTSGAIATPRYDLIYTAGAGGTISGETSQEVKRGKDATAVTAVPADHYHFVDWSDGSTANPRTDTNVQENASLTANFAIDTYTITYVAGANGTITGTLIQTVPYGGSTEEVTPIADDGYQFTQWSDDKFDALRTDTDVQADATYTAYFDLVSGGGGR